MKLTPRTIALSSVLALSSLSAQAGLTIPTNFLVADSVQTFPKDVLQLMELVYLQIEGRGTTTAVGPVLPETSNPSAFNFPITKIVIGSGLKIASGSAVGSALVFRAPNEEGTAWLQLTLANFTIDYTRGQVLADTTPGGGTTVKQQAIYNFNTASPLALKYTFPLSIQLHEVLDKLMLTPETKASFTNALALPGFAQPTLDKDFGSLTQKVTTKLRSRAISTRPYQAN